MIKFDESVITRDKSMDGRQEISVNKHSNLEGKEYKINE